MRTSLHKFFFVAIVLTALTPLHGTGQDLSGIWRGWFTGEDGLQYKCELQINQTGSRSISGVSYSYQETRFYGKATLVGMFNKNDQSVLIQEIKTVEVKMASDDAVCIMKYLMNYSRSGREEFLEGKFSSTYEKSDLLHKRGDPAGGGTVYLRKVTTSDFYIEPFLKDKKPVTPPQTRPQNRPQTKPPVNNKTKKPPVTKPQAPPKEKEPEQPKKDTVKVNREPVVIDKPKEIPRITIPETTRSRANELVRTLTVTSEEISVRLYDNGEVDGDTISVYMDGKPIVVKKGLSTVPITVKLKMDESNPEHVLVMVAENLGRIPPNTSVMIVQDGDKRYEVSITSTEQKNAMVRFRYQKK